MPHITLAAGFKALGHPTRLLLMAELVSASAPVPYQQLTETLATKAATLSGHLKILEEDGLARRSRNDDRSVMVAASAEGVKALALFLMWMLTELGAQPNGTAVQAVPASTPAKARPAPLRRIRADEPPRGPPRPPGSTMSTPWPQRCGPLPEVPPPRRAGRGPRPVSLR